MRTYFVRARSSAFYVIFPPKKQSPSFYSKLSHIIIIFITFPITLFLKKKKFYQTNKEKKKCKMWVSEWEFHLQHIDVVVDLKRKRFIQHCNKKTKLQNTVNQTQTLTSYMFGFLQRNTSHIVVFPNSRSFSTQTRFKKKLYIYLF